MLDINLYEELQKELKKAQENNDEFFIKNFKRILSRVEELKNIVGKKLTNEDVLVVLKDIYDDIKHKISEGQYSESKYSKEITKLMNLLQKYFVSTGYDFENYNIEQLSNGSDIEEVKKDIDKKLEISDNKNQIAFYLSIIGRSIIVFSFISGILFLLFLNDLNFLTIFLYFLFGTISGLMFLGFAEIIKILHDIRRKLYK